MYNDVHESFCKLKHNIKKPPKKPLSPVTKIEEGG